MSTKEKISELIDTIPQDKQEGVIGVIENFINSQLDETEWVEEISEEWKKRIEKSMKQAEEGLLIPHETVMKNLRTKLGLHD